MLIDEFNAALDRVEKTIQGYKADKAHKLRDFLSEEDLEAVRLFTVADSEEEALESYLWRLMREYAGNMANLAAIKNIVYILENQM